MDEKKLKDQSSHQFKTPQNPHWVQEQKKTRLKALAHLQAMKEKK